MNLNEWAKAIHENAVNHGWWEEERSFGEIIALCHSELSEALEEYRKGKGINLTYYSGMINDRKSLSIKPTSETNKPEGIPAELADCIIRILDYCGRHKLDIEEVVKIKHEYNKTRPYKHGGKVI